MVFVAFQCKRVKSAKCMKNAPTNDMQYEFERKKSPQFFVNKTTIVNGGIYRRGRPAHGCCRKQEPKKDAVGVAVLHAKG